MQHQMITPFRIVGEQVQVLFTQPLDGKNWSMEQNTNVPCTIVSIHHDEAGRQQYLVRKNDAPEQVGLATETDDDPTHGWGALQCSDVRRLALSL